MERSPVDVQDSLVRETKIAAAPTAHDDQIEGPLSLRRFVACTIAVMFVSLNRGRAQGNVRSHPPVLPNLLVTIEVMTGGHQVEVPGHGSTDSIVVHKRQNAFWDEAGR